MLPSASTNSTGALKNAIYSSNSGNHHTLYSITMIPTMNKEELPLWLEGSPMQIFLISSTYCTICIVDLFFLNMFYISIHFSSNSSENLLQAKLSHNFSETSRRHNGLKDDRLSGFQSFRIEGIIAFKYTRKICFLENLKVILVKFLQS